MTTVRFVSWGAITFGALAAGALSSLWGTRAALRLACALALLAPAVLLASRVRGLRRLEDLDA